MDLASAQAILGQVSAGEKAATGRHVQATPETVIQLRQTIAEVLQFIAKEGEVADWLQAERRVMQDELDLLADSAERISSLQTGLRKLAAALDSDAQLRDDPDGYRAHDRAMSLQENRIGDLPDDQARQFFKSHATRLRNDKNSRSHPSEIAVLDVRLAALKAAELKYIAKQRQVVLGLDRQPASNSDRHLGR